MTAFFEKSYKKTRIKKEAAPTGWPLFWCESGTRKGGTSPQTGVKSVRWTLFSPWESPSNSRRIRYGCGLDLNL